MLPIADLDFRAFDVPLDEPFGIAAGTQTVAQNVLVELRLGDGSFGLGEAAPFPAVNGETQAQVLSALPAARTALLGLDGLRLRPAARAAREALFDTPSALCAVESALLDAFTRHAGISLWSFFGAAESELCTDITIPTGSIERAAVLAARAQHQGFDTLKIKIGGGTLENDVARIQAVAGAAPVRVWCSTPTPACPPKARSHCSTLSRSSARASSCSNSRRQNTISRHFARSASEPAFQWQPTKARARRATCSRSPRREPPA